MSRPTDYADDARALGAVETGMNRRQMLTSLAGAVGLAPLLSKSGTLLAADGQVAPPTNPRFSTKPILTKADFNYLGCMRMPVGTDTTFAYGGLTGRKVGGQLRLFMFGNNPTLKDPLYEMADTGSYTKDYRSAPRMNLVTNWGDIYQGKRQTWVNGAPMTMQYLYPGGLYWNESTQLLYWTYFDAYNNVQRPDWNLGATSLDNPGNGSSRAFGPWRTKTVDGDGHVWYGASRIAGLTSTPDGKMGGFGAYFVTVAAPWGPQLFSGAEWPTAATPSGPNAPDINVPHRYVNYYFMGGRISAVDGTFQGPLRAFRRPSNLSYIWHPVKQGIATEVDPARNNGVGSWTNEDGLGGGIWLDLPDKHGIVFCAAFAGGPNANAATCGTGHIWYRNVGVGADRCTHNCVSPLDIAGPVTDAAFPALVIYNPSDAMKVRNGAVNDYTLEPTSIINLDEFGIRVAGMTQLGHMKALRGFYFDAERRLLFINANSADDSLPGLNTNLIHVFQIN